MVRRKFGGIEFEFRPLPGKTDKDVESVPADEAVLELYPRRVLKKKGKTPDQDEEIAEYRMLI